MSAHDSLFLVLVLTGGFGLVLAILAGLADYVWPALAAARRRRLARQIRMARPPATYR
jgi:hypothetical protein